MMKKYLFLILINVFSISTVCADVTRENVPASGYQGSDAVLQLAYARRQGHFQIQGQGTITRLLPDDLQGGRHQRFLLLLHSGQTLLVAHNIDLAPRVDGITKGDVVEFYGEYAWNKMGGVIHWTHHDPRGHHVSGWLKYQGKRYQ